MIRFATVDRAEPVAKLFSATEPRFVVSGDLVTMNEAREFIPNGRLCLSGNTIAAVLRAGDPLPSGFELAPVVQTNGTIYPGLFDLHNHLPYNHIPLWKVTERFSTRIEWQNIGEYYPAVRAPFSLLNANKKDHSYIPAVIRVAECRGLFGGVTTGHGMALKNKGFYAGFMRNVENPLTEELPAVSSYTADFDDKELANMLSWTQAGKPFIYHLAEGVGVYGETVFRQLEQTPKGLNPHLVCIHAVGIPADGWDAMKAVAGIVWSPTSNLLLYGETCNVAEAKKRGIPIAIGADWSPSGCKNLLGELKVARAVSKHLGGVLSDADLVAGVTCVPAKMIGWDGRLGSLEAGKWADLLILEGRGGDPYARMLRAKETSIRAVVIDGRVRLGEVSGLVIADPLSTEVVAIGGKAYVVDLGEPIPGGLDGVTLADAIAKVKYGLEHLPEIEASLMTLAALGTLEDGKSVQLVDEMAFESFTTTLLRAGKLPAKPMQLEPLTAVDDPNLAKSMRASVNMPDYAKKAFDD